MKSRVLGLACAAGLAAGCQSSAAKALSRHQATKDGANEVAQVSHETSAGLPGPSKRRDAAASSSAGAFEAGEKALQQFYRDKHDKPVHLQRARASFETAAKADPTSAAAQHRLAIVADLQERFRDSENHYRTALSLDPGNANIAADLGWSYILQDRWADAERELRRALELDPGSAIARDHLARCQQQQASVQMATTDRGPTGQMSANRPAAVAQNRPPEMPPQGRQWQPQPGTPGGPAIPPEHMGEYMRHQMSQVDNFGPAPTGQPLTIGPRSGYGFAADQQQRPAAAPPVYQAQQTTPQSPTQQYGGHQFGGGQFAGDQFGNAPSVTAQPRDVVPRQPVASASFPQANNQAGPLPQQEGQRHFSHYEPHNSSQHQAAPNQPQFTHGNMAQQTVRGPQQNQSWANRPVSPQDIQRTQGLELPSPPDQAIYQAPQLPPLPQQAAPRGPAETYTQQPQSPSGAPPAVYGQPTQQQPVSDPRQSANSLEQTRRNAALMGLGLGPGQLFPSLEQPADRMSPGSQSHMNGAAFPPPPVYSPDLTPPPDLRQNPSFFEQPAMTPPTNSMGQSLPGGTSNMMTPGSINDPNARFQQSFVNPAAGQMPQLPSPTNVWSQSEMQSGLQGYDGSRRAADQQLQQTLQSTWANTPSSAIPSPSSGVMMQQPAPPSQMMQESWGRQPVAPEPYPHAARPQQPGRGFEPSLPAVNPSQGRMPASPNPYPPAGRVSQPVYRDGVVVPEQYSQGRY